MKVKRTRNSYSIMDEVPGRILILQLLDVNGKSISMTVDPLYKPYIGHADLVTKKGCYYYPDTSLTEYIDNFL